MTCLTTSSSTTVSTQHPIVRAMKLLFVLFAAVSGFSLPATRLNGVLPSQRVGVSPASVQMAVSKQALVDAIAAKAGVSKKTAGMVLSACDRPPPAPPAHPL